MKKYEVNKLKIGHKILDIRTENKLSMMEFGKKIGVTDVSINAYEKGRMLPKYSVLKKLILFSNDTSLTTNKFIYGTPKEYIEDVFSELIASMRAITEKQTLNLLLQLLIKELEKELIAYGREKELVEKLYQLSIDYKASLDLRLNEVYVEMRKVYQLEPLRFVIESDEDYRVGCLPYLDILKQVDQDAYKELVELARNKVKNYYGKV